MTIRELTKEKRENAVKCKLLRDKAETEYWLRQGKPVEKELAELIELLKEFD